MIQKLITIITSLIALIFQDRATIKALREGITERDTIITDLREVIEDENADDAALEQAASDAKAAQATAETALAETNAELTAANTKADELVASITADPGIPITVDPVDGTVTPTP